MRIKDLSWSLKEGGGAAGGGWDLQIETPPSSKIKTEMEEKYKEYSLLLKTIYFSVGFFFFLLRLFIPLKKDNILKKRRQNIWMGHMKLFKKILPSHLSYSLEEFKKKKC